MLNDIILKFKKQKCDKEKYRIHLSIESNKNIMYNPNIIHSD